MRGRLRGFVLAAAATGLVVPAVAWADKRIDAGPPNRFTTPEVTMDQGERLTFHNGDTVAHDVTATKQGPDGKPLFKTPTVEGGKDAFVEGSQYLTTGHYEFICSIHPSMKGTVHVTGNGTPQKRPGSGSSGGGGSANPNDKQAPDLAVRIVSRRMRAVRTLHRLTVRVTLDETAHVVLRAVARPKVGGRLVTVARGQAHVEKGAARVRLRLTPAGRAAVKSHHRLAVIVRARATDGAGNRARTAHGKTLGFAG